VGFSKAFGLGVAEGIFESTANNMSLFLERDREEAKEIAKDESDIIRADSARYNTEYQGTKKEMRDLLGKVDNDPDALQYIISKYGYETAKKYINDIDNTHQTQGGIKATEMFKLAERDNGQPSVTIDQLARMQTTPVTVPKERDYSKLGGGFTRLFGGQDAMQDRIEGKIESRTSGLPGVGETLDDIPQVRLATDPLEKFEVGALATPKLETERLTRLAINAKQSGDIKLAGRLTNRRDVKLALAEVNTNRATGNELTTSQKAVFRKDILLTMNDIYKFTNDYDQLGNLRYGDTNADILQQINTQADALLEQITDLMKMGYSSESVIAKTKQAIFQNKKIGYDKSVTVISPDSNINEDVILKKDQMFDPTIFIQDITKGVNFNIFLESTSPFDPIYSDNEEKEIRNILRGLDIKTMNNVDEIIDDLVSKLNIPELDARKMINMMIK
tara:strand:+ start:740 stop:2080 length:1341 start_codon:yes stop_codon:yes gene_type:complete